VENVFVAGLVTHIVLPRESFSYDHVQVAPHLPAGKIAEFKKMKHPPPVVQTKWLLDWSNRYLEC